MSRGAGESVPVWRERHPKPPALDALTENVRADVCVVGAGIAGLTTAYLLQKEGLSTVVLDAWGLAAGETGRTTAHLTAALDDRFSRLQTLFGDDGARQAADSHRAAIDRVERIVRDEKIDCDFERVPGYLVALPPEQRELFEKEREAAGQVGFAGLEELGQVPVPGVTAGPALRFPEQAMFHPLRYVAGLAEAFRKSGGRIFVGARVREVAGGPDAHAETDSGLRADARHIVVATNAPISEWVRLYTKEAPYRTYVVAFEVPRGSYPGFLLWDIEDPYHYVRVARGDGRDWLLVGGEDHKTGQADDMAERYRRLEAWAKRHFAKLGSVGYRWSGQIWEPADSLAFIGRPSGKEENVYLATGDSGHGMTHGTLAGMLIADLIRGRPNPWLALYDPERRTTRATGDYLREDANFVARMIEKWVAPSDVANAEAVRPGQAAVLRQGASKIAVYRDEGGRLHRRSAVCTHLGCIVQWNPGEKSWDCPCHGSRFDPDGRVLNGPAVAPLKPADPDDKGDRS